jgi:hypothetical protein
LHPTAADALDADPQMTHGTIDIHLDILKIGTKRSPTNTGHFPANAAQVLGLTSASVLIAEHRFLTANRALTAHILIYSHHL